YSYDIFGNVPLLTKIGYGPIVDDEAKFEVTFDYEPREDELSDGRSGVLEVLEHRLVRVSTFVDDAARMSWALTYEDYADAGGFSRVMRVERFGANGGRFPIAFTFAYSKALGGLCDDADCDRPYLVDMGSVG